MNKLVKRLFQEWACRIEERQSGKYMLLDRLRRDCDYYLYMSSHPKYLWAENEVKQIAYMKKLYRSLVIKPEWISMKDIKMYEKLMIKH